MSQEKEYSDIVQDEAERLKEIMDRKREERARRLSDGVNNYLSDVMTVILAAPVIVVLFMFFGLILCEAAAFFYDPMRF